MLVKVFPLDDCIAALFEEALTLIWALNLLKTALHIKMVLHQPAFHHLSAAVATLELSLFAVNPDVVVHLVLH